MKNPLILIDDICEYFRIKNYIINDDLSVDVNGNVDLSSKNLSKIPLMFNIVMGNFDIRKNHIKQLKGAPKKIGGNFYCQFNNLKRLKYSPKFVGGDYFCNNNLLQSICGVPKHLTRNFICSNNNLLDLKYGPLISGNYDCSYNNLSSLQSLNTIINGDLYIYCNDFKDFNFKISVCGIVYAEEYFLINYLRSESLNKILED